MQSPNDWQLIDDGSWNGVKKYIRASDEDHGSVQVRYEGHDALPIVGANKSAQNEDFDRRSEFWHAAKIPVSVMYEWLTKYGVNAWNPAHADGVKKLLNDGEYRYLKTKNIIL